MLLLLGAVATFHYATIIAPANVATSFMVVAEQNPTAPPATLSSPLPPGPDQGLPSTTVPQQQIPLPAPALPPAVRQRQMILQPAPALPPPAARQQNIPLAPPP